MCIKYCLGAMGGLGYVPQEKCGILDPLRLFLIESEGQSRLELYLAGQSLTFLEGKLHLPPPLPPPDQSLHVLLQNVANQLTVIIDDNHGGNLRIQGDGVSLQCTEHYHEGLILFLNIISNDLNLRTQLLRITLKCKLSLLLLVIFTSC